MLRAWGSRSVAVGGDAELVVTGDHARIGVDGPPVHSAYLEQVRRTAPPELVEREEELAELAAFCQTGSGPSYAYWRAEAWAGKTALLSWFTLHAPPGVRIVSFFVTARWAAQNDAVAYVEVVLEQLAELAGEGLPPLLTAATREAHVLRLYGEAARACAERGERLVLLVDGLDEDRGVTTGPDAHSIASLLPYGLPAIVSGRLNPPLPSDVPEGHPLRDPAIARTLEPSPSARAIRAEAERELKRLLEAGGVEHDILALLTAAGGGLTADDLAELTDAVPYRVRDVLRTGPGRTFAPRADAYLLAHEELAVQAREMLGERELESSRARLHAWAAEWRERGWPEESPRYLLRGYFAMLRAAGDATRMTGCALDTVRQDRLLAVTGGDGAALGEIRAVAEAVLELGDGPDLVMSLLRLGIRRDALEHRNSGILTTLPPAWAAVGQIERAIAPARGMDEIRAVSALCAVADELLARGDRARATELVEEVEAAALRMSRKGSGNVAMQDVAGVLMRIGAHDRAARVVRSIGEDIWRRESLLALVQELCGRGEYGPALDLARTDPLAGVRAAATTAVCRALVRGGRWPRPRRRPGARRRPGRTRSSWPGWWCSSGSPSRCGRAATRRRPTACWATGCAPWRARRPGTTDGGGPDGGGPDGGGPDGGGSDGGGSGQG
ncbi:hypothetical protein Q5762_09950 [Streptomyces sp. P9(2023)]|uniref:hypothetical protein n=1 Tax=Streptomyces sp. P9(2023) TaxID=3064394 RepID=UPI0028F3FE01|nr:hypothetical protein [Streptomyces sp. P9(2023)]MDT9688672.1 hypothetical protein [Streptomyces sp. P9(2023)]